EGAPCRQAPRAQERPVAQTGEAIGIIMSWDTDLTGTHLQIAASAAPRIRVMAGPGTGKSFAMKRRIARLLEADGVDPHRILAVTFTRTAARVLERELQDMRVPGCENIVAGRRPLSWLPRPRRHAELHPRCT